MFDNSENKLEDIVEIFERSLSTARTKDCFRCLQNPESYWVDSFFLKSDSLLWLTFFSYWQDNTNQLLLHCIKLVGHFRSSGFKFWGRAGSYNFWGWAGGRACWLTAGFGFFFFIDFLVQGKNNCGERLKRTYVIILLAIPSTPNFLFNISQMIE